MLIYFRNIRAVEIIQTFRLRLYIIITFITPCRCKTYIVIIVFNAIYYDIYLLKTYADVYLFSWHVYVKFRSACTRLYRLYCNFFFFLAITPCCSVGVLAMSDFCLGFDTRRFRQLILLGNKRKPFDDNSPVRRYRPNEWTELCVNENIRTMLISPPLPPPRYRTSLRRPSNAIRPLHT